MSDRKLKRISLFVAAAALLLVIGGGISKYYLGLYAKFIPIQGEYGIYGEIDDENGNFVITQKIIVVDPPRNAFCKNIIIRKYDRENPLSEAEIKFAANMLSKYKEKTTHFSSKRSIRCYRIFYKESSDTHQKWDGRDDPDKDGWDAMHKGDMIASVCWKSGDVGKKYKMLDFATNSLFEQAFDLMFWRITGLHWSM